MSSLGIISPFTPKTMDTDLNNNFTTSGQKSGLIPMNKRLPSLVPLQEKKYTSLDIDYETGINSNNPLNASSSLSTSNLISKLITQYNIDKANNVNLTSSSSNFNTKISPTQSISDSVILDYLNYVDLDKSIGTSAEYISPKTIDLLSTSLIGSPKFGGLSPSGSMTGWENILEEHELWNNTYDNPTLKLITPISKSNIISTNESIKLPQSMSEHSLKQIDFSNILSTNIPSLKNYSTNLISTEMHNLLAEIKNIIPNYETDSITLSNPFNSISESIFLNRGIIMANIDAVFNLCPKEGGLIAPKSPYPLIFCSLNDAPGGFTQYIQWKCPNAYGYGISVAQNKDGIKWEKDAIDISRFNIDNCPDGTGNVVQNVDYITNWILEKAQLSPDLSIAKLNKDNRGVELVLANGGSSIGKNVNGLIIENENIVFPVILAEVLIALKILWPNGSMVVRLFEIFNENTAGLLYIVSNLFNYVTLFKPLSSHSSSTEIYLIARGYNKNRLALEAINLLTKANSIQISNSWVTNLINIPKAFTDNLRIINDKLIQRITINYKWIDLINQMDPKNRENFANLLIPKYLNYYAPIYWNVPS